MSDVILPGRIDTATPLPVQAMRRRALSWSVAALSLLLIATTWIYAPSLNYGLMWDDPHWFGRVAGKSIVELVQATPDYHFYRPAGLLYVRLFMSHTGLLDPVLLHLLQIGWHALNVALAYSLSRALGVGRTMAFVVAVLVALHPFSQQAVAWAAPLQVVTAAMLGGAWLFYLEARRQRGRWQPAAAVSVVLFVAALFVQESGVTLSFVPILFELLRWSRGRRPRPGSNGWLALVYPTCGAGFGLLWLLMPRQAGYTALALEPQVTLYMLQGMLFPLLGRPWGYGAADVLAGGIAWLGLLVALALLLGLAWRAGNGQAALFGLAWAALGLALPVIGLHYSYAAVAPRLFYFAAPGTALIWAAVLVPARRPELPRKVWRLVGGLLLAGIMVQSVFIVQSFNRAYAHGAAHLDELVQAATPAETEFIFVNFPDRYTPQRPPFPLGYWGVTLAPVVADLAAFPAILTGASVRTHSFAMPWLDEEVRAGGPYQVDMRGEIISPDDLYRLARHSTFVYRTVYQPDGAFSLVRAGAIEAPGGLEDRCPLALFDDRLCLRTAVAESHGDELRLHLIWSLSAPAVPHEAIFVHLGRPGEEPIAQADGDPWLGMLPLYVWQLGDWVHEWRSIALPRKVGGDEYLVRIGFYNWVSQERYKAVRPNGERWPSDAAVVGRLQNGVLGQE
jgi:hypothetical protein